MHGFWVSLHIEKMSAEEKKEFFTYTMKLLEDKVIEPFSGENFKLSEFADAVRKQNVSYCFRAPYVSVARWVQKHNNTIIITHLSKIIFLYGGALSIAFLLCACQYASIFVR